MHVVLSGKVHPNLKRRRALRHSYKPSITLAPDLTSMLRRKPDIKFKRGVIGLLEHLAYPARSALSEAGIVKRLVNSNVFRPIADMTEMVQVNIVIRHLCGGNGEPASGLFVHAGRAERPCA